MYRIPYQIAQNGIPQKFTYSVKKRVGGFSLYPLQRKALGDFFDGEVTDSGILHRILIRGSNNAHMD